MIWLAQDGILLAGDTVEDTVTYVAEPESFAVHLADLDRLATLKPQRNLPNHGAPELIAAGGYGPASIGATQDYIRKLMAARSDADLRALPLRDWIAPALASRTLTWFEPYETVPPRNREQVTG